MYNPKDIQFVGKHDFDRKSAERFASWGGTSFSINIFQWQLNSSGKRMKRSVCKVRVKGLCATKENAFANAENIVQHLDQGTWDGRKTVIVK